MTLRITSSAEGGRNIILSIEDITERKQIESEQHAHLERVQKEKYLYGK